MFSKGGLAAEDISRKKELTEHQMRVPTAPSNQRTSKGQRRVYVLLALSCLANCWPAASLSAEESFNLNTANFAIYTHDGATLVGRSHYGVEHVAGGAVVLGDNSYADGERDVERDTVEFPSPAQMPVTCQIRALVL